MTNSVTRYGMVVRHQMVATLAIGVGVVGTLLLPVWHIAWEALWRIDTTWQVQDTLAQIGLAGISPLPAAILLVQVFCIALIVWGGRTLLVDVPPRGSEQEEANTDKLLFRRFLSFVVTTTGAMWLLGAGLCTASFVRLSGLPSGDLLGYFFAIVGGSSLVGVIVYSIGRWLRPRVK